jgi:hypothetical protein
MSTILKALRRLDQQKTPTNRPLREQVTGLGGDDRDAPRASRRWPILVAGIAAGVVAGVCVLLLVLRHGEPAPLPIAVTPAPVLANSPPQPPPAQSPRRARASSPSHAAPAPAAVAELAPPLLASDDVEVLDRGVPPPRVVAPEPADAAVAAPVPAEPPPGSVRPFEHAERRARKAPQAPVPAPVIAAEPPARTPALRPQPVVETPAPQAAKAPIPEVAPAQPKAASPPAREPAPTPDPFPALRVERTTWHPVAERRLALVDVPGEGPRELREGDRVAGATVASIEPSGVVFRFAGRDVRRKVGGGS